jgi:hypothetical protein
MHGVLSYDCKVLRPEDAEDRAMELRERLARLVSRDQTAPSVAHSDKG